MLDKQYQQRENKMKYERLSVSPLGGGSLKISMCVGRGRGLISALYRRDHFGEEDRAQIAVYRCVVVSGSERHLKTLNV
jgi:hypothetical protein